MIRDALAAAYGVGLRGREWLYRSGIAPSIDLPARVVSVGNLSAGGSGKTPLVSHLAGKALTKGLSTWILTRGYGRRSDEPVLVKPGETPPTAREIGDEPLLLKRRHLQAGLVVHADRGAVALREWKKIGCELVLLDDGFQHWRIRRDLDILVIDLSGPAIPRLLPVGRAREGREALARADAVVFTRASQAGERETFAKATEVDRALRALGRREPGKGNAEFPWKRAPLTRLTPFFFVDYRAGELRLSDGGAKSPSTLKGKPVIAASGIANPASFRLTLESLGAKLESEIVFPDHHWLGAKDVARIALACERNPDALLVVTEKDAARWQAALPAASPRYAFLSVDLEFVRIAPLGSRAGTEEDLWGLVAGKRP